MFKSFILFFFIFLLVACQSNQSNLKSEARSKPMRGDYWLDRYTYPTQQFNPEWYVKARVEHNKNTSRTPIGKFSKNKKLNRDVLDVESFTALGPKP